MDYPSSLRTGAALLCLLAILMCVGLAHAQEAEQAPSTEETQSAETGPSAAAAQPLTTADPAIPVDELALLVKPLTVDELKVEAEGWLQLLKDKTRQTAMAELAIKRKNRNIERAEQVQDSIEDARDALQEVKEVSREARQEGDLATAEEAQELARKAQDAVENTAGDIEAAIEAGTGAAQHSEVSEAVEAARQAQVEELVDQTTTAREASAAASDAAGDAVEAAEAGNSGDVSRLADETVQAAKEASSALKDSSEVIDEAARKATSDSLPASPAGFEKTDQLAAEIAEKEQADKDLILDSVTDLRAERVALTDRLNVVLDDLSSKLGTTADGVEHEYILPFRLYATSVNGIEVDISDTQTFLTTIIGWLTSDVGGIRLARNLGYFLLSVVSFWVLGWVLGKLVNRALLMTRVTLELMRSVIVRSVRNVTVLVGIIIGLAAMGINIGPILAVVGAAGFVIAFALQNTLSNFASGIMIMIYQPFDVGDIISVGGVTGEARSMNLVSTTIATKDNQLLVVPNNTIWGNIITNITGSDTRRVDLVFRISYEDDIEQAQAVIREVVETHPMVLDEPEPVIAVGELGPVSVNLICRPWARTSDYWDVYRELTRAVKERFQAAGMEPPYLQANLRGADILAGVGTAAPAPASPTS